MTSQERNVLEQKLADQPAQPQALPFGVGGGLVAIRTLLSRDPCAHASIAIEMIDAILADQPAQPQQDAECPYCCQSCGAEIGIYPKDEDITEHFDLQCHSCGSKHGNTGCPAPVLVKQAVETLKEIGWKWDFDEAEFVAEQPAQPQQGWKLVPVEPTTEMLTALSGEWHSSRHHPERYEAMLNAAPQPPQRKPLTDEQRMIEMVDAAMVATRDIVPRITRSQCRLIIEAAHGITEE